MSIQDKVRSIDYARWVEIFLKYWYVFALAGVVIYFSINQYCATRPPEAPDHPRVPPVDYSIDQSRLHCLSRRAPDDIVRVCNKVPSNQRMSCYGQLLPERIVEVCVDAF